MNFPFTSMAYSIPEKENDSCKENVKGGPDTWKFPGPSNKLVMQ